MQLVVCSVIRVCESGRLPPVPAPAASPVSGGCAAHDLACPNFPIGDDYLPTVKYDGTCVLYFNGKWYCKRNITKKTASKWITSPEDLSGCVFFPDETNLMRVYWAPITPKDKWHNQAILEL